MAAGGMKSKWGPVRRWPLEHHKYGANNSLCLLPLRTAMAPCGWREVRGVNCDNDSCKSFDQQLFPSRILTGTGLLVSLTPPPPPTHPLAHTHTVISCGERKTCTMWSLNTDSNLFQLICTLQFSTNTNSADLMSAVGSYSDEYAAMSVGMTRTRRH